MKTPKLPVDPLDSMKAPLKPPPIDPKEAIKGHQAGDGIRSMETSSVFRTLNFELYVKPNKYFMAFGITAISCCVGYLAYMKHQHREQGLYTAIDDNDQMYLTKKRSKWD